MPKSLEEYAAWLDERQLLWPAAPEPEPPKATPYLKPLPEIKAVTWNIYGTLLLVSGGKLEPLHPQQIRMQVALEKTIHEFNMWNSMSRKPGAPWEYMFQQYKTLIEDKRLTGAAGEGETAEVNSAHVWRSLIERLGKKEYSWDEESLGDIDEFSEKVAFFFHASLQGVVAAPNALAALRHVAESECQQGLIGDAQPFTIVQLIRALRAQGDVPPLNRLLTAGCVSLSFAYGVKQPSPRLFEDCLNRLREEGVEPGEVLHVASRLADELAPAKKLGMRTALYAGDKTSLQATAAEVNDPALRPDRILTDLRQIRQILKRE